MGPLLSIVVFGTPGTAGSKSAFPIWRTTPDGRKELVRINQVEKDLKHIKRDWRTAVMAAAKDLIVVGDKIVAPYPLDEALRVDMVFTVAKPKSAPKTIRTWPAVKPDRGKFGRATEDALIAAGVIKDDGRIVAGETSKCYPGEGDYALAAPGVVIRIWRMTDLYPGAPPPTRRDVDEVLSLFE